MKATNCLSGMIISIFLSLFSLPAMAIDNANNKRKVVLEILSNNNAPLSFLNDKGEPDGFSIELCKAIIEELKDSCDFDFIQPGDDVQFDTKDSTNYIYALFYSKDRAENISFSVPFITIYYDVLFREGDTYNGLGSLAGKKIIMKNNVIVRQILKDLGDEYIENLIFVDDMEVGLKMLSGGEGDFALCMNANADKIVSECGLTNLHSVASGLLPQELFFASSNPALIMQINRAINALIRNGEYHQIYHKWYGKDESVYMDYFYWTLGVLAAVALLSFFVFILLRIRIKKATTKIKASNARIMNLNQLTNILIGESEIDIFLYDIREDLLYVLKNGDFKEYSFSLRDIEAMINPDDRGRYDKCFEDVLSGTRDKATCSLRIYNNKINRFVDYEYVVTGQKDDEGNICKLLYSRRNETRQRKLLRRQDETILNLDLALQSAKLIRWRFDFINDVIKIVDYQSNRWTYLESEWVELIAPNSRALYEDFISKVLQDRDVDFVTIFVKLPDSDTYQPFELTAVARYNKDGELLSLHGIMNNISTIYNYQSLLSEKIELLKAINNHIPLGVVFLDRDGFVRDVNDYLVKLFALKDKTILLNRYNYLVDPQITDQLPRLNNGEVVRYQLEFDELPDSLKSEIDRSLPHGEMFEVSVNGVFDTKNSLIGYLLLFDDVTEAYKSQQKIVELQNNVTLALEAGELTTWIYDVDKQEFALLQGIDSADNEVLSRESYNKIVHPDDKNVIWDAMDVLIDKQLKKTNVKFRLRLGGHWCWYQCSLMASEDNNCVRFITGTRKDITEEVRAKQMLNQRHQEVINSEERLNLIMNSLPIPVYIIDVEHKHVAYINDAAIKLFGSECYVTTKDFVKDEDVAKHANVDQQVISTGNEYIANELLRLRNGKELNTFVRKMLIEFNGQKQILVMRMDLTEQYKAQMTNKIISTSLPALKAYTWHVDSRDGILRYGEILATAERNLLEYNTLDKFTSLIYEEDREGYDRSMKDLMNNDFNEGAYCYRVDIQEIGVYEWWESRAIVETLLDEEGKPYKFVYGIDLNVNAQKVNELALKKNQRKLAALNRQNELILNNNTSGIVYLDANYNIQWSNVDYVFGEIGQDVYVKGTQCYSAFGMNKPCPNCPVANTIASKEICYQEFHKKKRIFGSTAIPIIGDSGVEGIVLRIDDITERNRLITDLRRAKEKAEESEKLKMAFLANMSHEIRTPLNAIVGFSEMMQYAEDEVERKEYMHIINNNNELLLRLIGDVLDLSKIESGSMEIKNETFDVVEMINETFTALKARCSNPQIEMKLELPLSTCVATLDRNRFSQVAINFLSNAIKYTKEGEIIFGINQINNGLRIYVKDTGIGIEENKHHLIFQRFEKLDTFAQGTGLGLAICKAIMDAIGGEIGCNSVKDEGSTFWAWFPCEIEKARKKREPKELMVIEKPNKSDKNNNKINTQLNLFFNDDKNEDGSEGKSLPLWN